jgi:hypothetical protein
MDDFKTTSIPLFKKIDVSVFEKIDKFKSTPTYNNLQDFYNGLDEEQQKVFKAFIILIIFIIPMLLLGLILWQNNNLKKDLETRIALVTKANEIIGQRKSLRTVIPSILSENPIDGYDMMSSRISNLLSASGIDLSKLKINNYKGDPVTTGIMRSEADLKFSNISTDELMNIFINLIQREKFRVQNVAISRNAETNLLSGEFHAIHLGNFQQTEEE